MLSRTRIPLDDRKTVIFKLGYLYEINNYWRHGIFRIFKVLQSDFITLYKDMHIIYHFKAFEKSFQMNVNASRNISNTVQSTLKYTT